MKRGNDKTNGEARCFLCQRDKLNDFTFEEDDYLSLIFKSKLINPDKNDDYVAVVRTKVLNNIQINNNELLKPCKCGNVVHLACLIQYCLLHLTFRCDECQNGYNVSFPPYDGPNGLGMCSVYTQITLTILFHILLLVVAIIIIILDVFPEDCKYWEYLLAIIIILLDASIAYGNFHIMLDKWKKSKITYSSFASFSDGEKKSEMEYIEMKTYLEQILDIDIHELMEKKSNSKMFINSTLLYHRELNEYIANNNNDEFDTSSEAMREELKEQEMAEKFHGHQIIKSTLIQNDKNSIKNLLSKQGTIKSNINDVKQQKKQTNNAAPRDDNANVKKNIDILQLNSENNKQGENNNVPEELNSRGKLVNVVKISVEKQGSRKNSEGGDIPVEAQVQEKLTLLRENQDKKN